MGKSLVLVTVLVASLMAAAPVSAQAKTHVREVRQNSADQMVQNILRWLQGVYSQQSRTSRFAYDENYDHPQYLPFNNVVASPRIDTDAFRQGTLREYLPPTNTQKPRPFEPRPNGDGTDENGNFIDGGYPPAGSITPQPPFPTYTTTEGGYPSGGRPEGSEGSTLPPPSLPTRYPDYPSFPTQPPTGYPERPGFSTGPPQTPYPTQPPTGYPERPEFPTGYPGFPTGGPQTYPTDSATGYPERPGFSTGGPPLTYPTGYTDRPGFPTAPPPGVTTRPPYVSPDSSTSAPSYVPDLPTQAPSGFTGYPTQQTPGAPTEQPQGGYGSSTYLTLQPTDQQTPGYPTAPQQSFTPETPAGVSTFAPSGATGQTNIPTKLPGELSTSVSVTLPPVTESSRPEATTSPGETPEVPGDNVPTGSGTDEDRHPPHIHAIDVQCAKDMMTINIEFNREFNGVIYSKGFYHMPECRYVSENSGQTKYSFTVNLNMCGTEFINAFDTQRQSYLENVLVLQNEPGIQEVWDTVRSVRCLWEGNLKDHLSVSLMVGMLTQEIVTFSGDTAMAKLDILLGRGPFGQPANGLIKIGEPMTLVVSVSGDPGFDIQVKDCRATDTTGSTEVQLTDDDGCILKPKLFGAFQKTRNTENTGASIIAYAYFNAFKFPDVMDLMIECNIELCKTDCEMCSKTDQILEPAKRRRRRDVSSFYNESIHNGLTMGKHLRVVLPEDLAATAYLNGSFCMSTQNFMLASGLLISLLTLSSVLSIWLWCRMQGVKLKG